MGIRIHFWSIFSCTLCTMVWIVTIYFCSKFYSYRNVTTFILNDWWLFLFKERFTRGAVIGCLIAISGSIVIGWQDFKISGEALYGDILAFIAAGIITAYFFISQYVRKDLSLIPYSIISYGSSACFLGVFAYMQNESFIHYSTQTWLYFLA